MNRYLLVVSGVTLPIILTALAFAACGGSNRASAAGPVPTVAESTTTSPADTTPATATAAAIASEPARTTTEAQLDDGRHFGYIKSVDVETSPHTLVFDLAYFFKGDEANREAAKRGYPTPVDNDIFIVNEIPRLRTLALAADPQIMLFDWRHCCEKFLSVRPERFASFFGRRKPSLYPRGEYAAYWITVESGLVVKIEEQFRP